jgi:hypothetical protein
MPVDTTKYLKIPRDVTLQAVWDNEGSKAPNTIIIPQRSRPFEHENKDTRELEHIYKFNNPHQDDRITMPIIIVTPTED